VQILVVNAGSSSLKLRLLGDGDELLAERELPAPRSVISEHELRSALADGLDQADAVGHRIVHGGERFRGAVVVDAEVEQALRDLVDLAPLHQPKSLAAYDAVSRALPGVPAIACFDTAFHASLPPAAATFALPASWRRRWGLRRYGFHGLSHAYASRRLAELIGRQLGDLRVVSCHLGAGASLAAVRGGRSVDTTMGFTPLDGLVMATRSGSVDPGLLMWLLTHRGVSADEMADALEYEAGLSGLAGTADMREILARAAREDPDAQLALDVYVHRLVAGVAAMAAALGGLDALAFTGGVGERASAVRAAAAGRLAFLGVAIIPAANESVVGDAVLSAPDARVGTAVVRAREDLEIARQVRSVLTASASSTRSEQGCP
jgi:acetate kinase